MAASIFGYVVGIMGRGYMGIIWDHGKENGSSYTVLGYIGIIGYIYIYRGYIGIKEKKWKLLFRVYINYRGDFGVT